MRCAAVFLQSRALRRDVAMLVTVTVIVIVPKVVVMVRRRSYKKRASPPRGTLGARGDTRREGDEASGYTSTTLPH
ncbi:MAG TPA: hypothetical protein VH054_07980 [Polyangiaceae bacterium]|nr:hypothetical protein [Polyangiaceae bacterium]